MAKSKVKSKVKKAKRKTTRAGRKLQKTKRANSGVGIFTNPPEGSDLYDYMTPKVKARHPKGSVGVFTHPPKRSGLYDFVSKTKTQDELHFRK